ncbi:MAG TPA: lactate racemase domain-containing protein [Fimbriiglobus sp.]|nr:lactate racemase domain-containing protein [Fimbriiglobus sp.]
MSSRIELLVGQTTWALTVRPEATAELKRAPFSPPTAGPRELVRAALERPSGLDAPLRRALTPDDHVAIVLDERLPHTPELLAGVIEHIQSAGIHLEAVTVVVPPGGNNSPWVDDLPDEFADVHLETHDPEERKKLAYLATTRAGRRVYLNRTLVEADFTVVLTGRGYDPTFGYAGAEVALFPALSDAETLAESVGRFSLDPPGPKPVAARAEAAEIGWLFGTPFFVQVIEGAYGTVQEVVAGLSESTAEGVHRQDARWHATVEDRPDLVIAAISGPPDRVDFLALASAAAAAARVVQPGGRIAVLTDAAPPLEEGAEILRQADDPDAVGKVLARRKPDDWPAAALWAFAAGQANLFMASGWPNDVTEELFATPIASAAEVQRLIDAAERVLIIPDAHKTIVELR